MNNLDMFAEEIGLILEHLGFSNCEISLRQKASYDSYQPYMYILSIDKEVHLQSSDQRMEVIDKIIDDIVSSSHIQKLLKRKDEQIEMLMKELEDVRMEEKLDARND